MAATGDISALKMFAMMSSHSVATSVVTASTEDDKSSPDRLYRRSVRSLGNGRSSQIRTFPRVDAIVAQFS